MPRNLIGMAPFPPVLLFDENRSFTLDDLHRITQRRKKGASICIRYPEGPDKRGGYFFHFAPKAGAVDEFKVYDFEKRLVATFPAGSLIAFINHCTGRKFDEASFILCQTELNFLKDEEPNA
jgi:hypothetical protein